MNLDGVVMCVSSTAEQGVVCAGTRLRFTQKAQEFWGNTAAVRSRGAAWWARSRDHSWISGMRKWKHPARYTGAVRFVR
jgi:hypothetical protein